jgi:hypothetical protein
LLELEPEPQKINKLLNFHIIHLKVVGAGAALLLAVLDVAPKCKQCKMYSKPKEWSRSPVLWIRINYLRTRIKNSSASFSIVEHLHPFPELDPHQYDETPAKHIQTTVCSLNLDPIRIRIHNSGIQYTVFEILKYVRMRLCCGCRSEKENDTAPQNYDTSSK